VSGKCSQTFFEKTSNGCSMMQFTEDGSLLIIVFNENWRVWHTKTFERLHISGGPFRYDKVCVSLDSSKIAIVESFSDEVKVFGSSSLKSACVRSVECHSVRITCAACNSSGTIFATGSLNGNIKLWNSSCDNVQTLQVHILKVVSVNFDSNDDRLCSASIDMTIRIWNCSTGECDFFFTAECEFNSLYDVNILSAYFSDGSAIAAVYTDGFIKVWDKTGACLRKYDHSNIYDEKFSDEVVERIQSSCYNKEKSLLACSDSRFINIWNTTTGECTKTLDSCRTPWFNYRYGRQPVCFNTEGSKIVAGCVNSIICFDVGTGEVINCACVLDPVKSDDNYFDNDLAEEYCVKSVCFSFDESMILAGVYNAITIISSTTFETIYTLQGHTIGVESLCSISQNRVISAFRDGIVKLWDTSSITDVSGDYHKHKIDANTATSVCGNYANDNVIILSNSNESCIWDIVKGQKVDMIQDGNMMCICYSHNGSRVAGGYKDHSLIKIWSVPNVKCILTLSGHSGSVCVIEYSNDDSKIVSGCWHVPEIKLWNAITGECLHTIEEDKLPGCYNVNRPISFTHDGSKLIWISGRLNRLHDDDETNSIKILNTETYEYIDILMNVGATGSICCSDDIIVAGSREESSSMRNSFFKIFSISSGQCTYTYVSSPTPNYSTSRQIQLAISPSGKRIISALNMIINIWSTDGECLYTSRPFTDNLTSLNCTYDATKIICIGDGDIVSFEFHK
jgi:WD40 repeat protein